MLRYATVRSMPSARLDKLPAPAAHSECVVCGWPILHGGLCHECAVLATRMAKGDHDALPAIIRRYNEGND